MFGQRGNLGRDLRAVFFAGAQGHHLATADVRQTAGEDEHAELQVVADQVGGQRGHTAVGDVGHENARLFLDHFTGQVQRGAHAGAAVAEAAGIGLGQLDELFGVFHPHPGGSHQHQRLRGDQADGCEVLPAVFDGGRHQPVDRHFVVGAHQQGIAIGCGVEHLLGANRTTGPPHILDHNGGVQAFGQRGRHHPPGQVGAAPWGVTHHDSDRLGGVVVSLGVDCRGQGGHGAGQKTQDVSQDRGVHCGLFHVGRHSRLCPAGSRPQCQIGKIGCHFGITDRGWPARPFLPSDPAFDAGGPGEPRREFPCCGPSTPPAGLAGRPRPPGTRAASKPPGP